MNAPNKNTEISYQPVILKQLEKEIDEGKKVCCYGDVMDIKHLDSIIFFFICDGTATTQCLLFKDAEFGNLSEHPDIVIGAFLSILGITKVDFKDENKCKIKVKRYRGMNSVVKNFDEQCQIAIRTTKIVCDGLDRKVKCQNQLARNTNKVAKVKQLVIPANAMDYRTILFQILYSLFERTPEINQFKFSIQTVIKQQIAKDFMKQHGLQIQAAQAQFSKALSFFCHYRMIELFKDCYSVKRCLFSDIETQTLQFIREKNETGTDPAHILQYLNEHLLGGGLFSETTLGIKAVHAILRKLQYVKKIYRTSGTRIFVCD